MKMTLRDSCVGQDYLDGKEINEIARGYGLSERRISQILSQSKIKRRPRSGGTKKALSQMHIQIGLHLYTYRTDKKLEISDTAGDLDWSILKLRNVENGVTELELLDLLVIAAYTTTGVGDLMEKLYAV